MELLGPLRSGEADSYTKAGRQRDRLKIDRYSYQ